MDLCSPSTIMSFMSCCSGQYFCLNDLDRSNLIISVRVSTFAFISAVHPFLLYPFYLDTALEFSKESIILLVVLYLRYQCVTKIYYSTALPHYRIYLKTVHPLSSLAFRSMFQFYVVSGWYRKLFETENAVPPKKLIFVRKRRY